MKKWFPVLIAVLVLLFPVSLAETAAPGSAAVPADPAAGSRLAGLYITKEDISPLTGEEGLLWASVSGEGSDAGPEYRFEAVNGLRLICFTVPGDGDEGGSVVSNVDDGITAADFSLSEDTGSVRMKATVSVVPKQEEEVFFFNPVLRTEDGRVYTVPGDGDQRGNESPRRRGWTDGPG